MANSSHASVVGANKHCRRVDRINALWRGLRKLRFTASKLGDILKANTSWK